MDWEKTINELIDVAHRNGCYPERIVLNKFTYDLIMAGKGDCLQTNRSVICGLRVKFDNSYRNLKKIVLEIDSGF